MKINGIGNVSKTEILSVFTKEGVEAVRAGEITMEEAASTYKKEMVKKNSAIGNLNETFEANYEKIPDEVKEKLSPRELAMLTDEFYKCYSDGKNSAK